MGPEGGYAIADALKVMPSVTHLVLSSNNLGAEGARAVSEMLIVNQSVTHLDMTFNDLRPDGARALAETLLLYGCVIDCRGVNEDVYPICERNKAMHKRAHSSVLTILSIR